MRWPPRRSFLKKTALTSTSNTPVPAEPRYRDFNSHLRERFGCRVQKITLDAGLSCPNRDGTLSREGCLYCNARGSGTGASAKGLSIPQQIRQARSFLEKRYKTKKFLAYFQSFTNTHAPVETLRALYGEALAEEGAVGLCIGTRPDCVGEPVLDLLTGFAGKTYLWVEYGLQSAKDRTLAAINRGHNAEAFADAVARTRGRNILICGHVILGLPGETRKDMLDTARFVADLNLDGIKVHLLYVVRGTGMEALYNEGKYSCMEQDEYVETVCDFLELLPPDMVIQRLTGDPHPQELAAPQWALGSKSRTLEKINHELARRDSWQGKLHKG